VFPGGQLDKEETFTEALLREIYEEIGIKIDRQDNNNFYYKNATVKITPILLYESSFAPKLSDLITSQILILYYRIDINEEKENIALKIQVEEVDAYAWINLDLLKLILFPTESSSKEFIFVGHMYNESEFCFCQTTYDHNNFHKKDTDEIVPYGHYLACKYL
jgi:ADP-ribose pyrophosphatase YjhB (NUDIX family)